MPRAATLDIDRLLGKTRNRVQYVGLELEGGWTSLPEGVNLVGDGSVQVPELSRESSSTGRRQVGELQSEPMPLLKVEPWLKKFYPQCVNKSCGLHVHMSFRSALHYMWLMRPEYQRTMLDYLLKWATSKNFGENHVIWPRLKGKNAYCADSYWADIQASQTSKSYSHDGASRYTAINYCYGQHETVECRVLPMFDKVEQSIEAVHQVIAITNAVLALSAKKEKRESSSTMADEMGIIIEESTIRV